MAALEKLRNGMRILRKEGPSGIARSLRYHFNLYRETRSYQTWMAKYDTLTESDISDIRVRIGALKERPLFSIVMPVYNTPEIWLRRAIESVSAQLYDNWELCIADDHSRDSHVRPILEEYSQDKRVHVMFREHNGHISAASNSALELATGDFVVLLDHDDELSPSALAELAFEIDRFPDTNMLYSDEDVISISGKRYMPKFKPDWSPELFYSMNLVTHLAAYRTNLVKDRGGFREGFEGSQDYDLASRIIESIQPETIRHIPRILYHWRAVEGSAASGLNSKPYAYDRARMAIDEHFVRIGINARSVEAPLQINRTVFTLPDPAPSVSIIIVEDSEKTSEIQYDYAGHVERIFVSTTEHRASNDPNIRFVPTSDFSRFSRLNIGAEAARGDILCFLHSSSRAVNDRWLCEVVGRAVQAGVGCVGAKILFPDRTIKHAGYFLGIKGGVGRAHYRSRSDVFGNYMRLVVDQNFSAVSADCLVIRRPIFEAFGGFDAARFPDRFADIDLCLRLQASGYRVVWTPWAELTQKDEEKQDSEMELSELKRRWPDKFARDPFYNPNLTAQTEDLSLAFPPRRVR